MQQLKSGIWDKEQLCSLFMDMKEHLLQEPFQLMEISLQQGVKTQLFNFGNQTLGMKEEKCLKESNWKLKNKRLLHLFKKTSQMLDKLQRIEQF